VDVATTGRVVNTCHVLFLLSDLGYALAMVNA
jgi:hypothetical protein